VKLPFLSLILLLAAPIAVGQDNTSNCISCHQAFEDEDEGPSYRFGRDVHSQEGIGCEGCHGGDPTLEDMDEVRQTDNYRGVPSHLEVPEFCARCHSDASYMHDHDPSLPVDQLEKYRTSVHGRRLFGEGDTLVANCVSCHGVHIIAGPELPHSPTYPQNIPATCGKCHANKDYMSGYNIPTDQLAEYRESVHGKALLQNDDLGAPACNDCHGNHGAAPPGVGSLSMVCGLCHAIEEQMFDDSPHQPAFTEYDFPMCETCHSNHKIVPPSDTMVGMGQAAVCSDCHSPDDGTRGAAVADTMSALITRLVNSSQQARQLLQEAAAKGMHTTDESFLMKDVEQALIQTRTRVHLLNVDSLATKATYGMAKADTVMTKSAGLIDEYYFRRKGLGVATLIITLLAILLYVKIRRLS
jgi:predicted CXXCH cytochrome family protein